MYDDLFRYLEENNMLDDNFDIKETITCPKCKKDLYKVKKGLLYCKKCNIYTDYDSKKQIANKELKK